MPRAVSLYLPVWPADRLRRQLGTAAPLPKKPLVFAGQDGGRRTVVAANPAALALGLHPGLALAEAQALVPDLYVAAADPEADTAALKRLALWALRRYSPLIAVDPPDGLLIGAAGVAHLFGGEAALLDDLLARLWAADLHARAASRIRSARRMRLPVLERSERNLLRRAKPARPSARACAGWVLTRSAS